MPLSRCTPSAEAVAHDDSGAEHGVVAFGVEKNHVRACVRVGGGVHNLENSCAKNHTRVIDFVGATGEHLWCTKCHGSSLPPL